MALEQLEMTTGLNKVDYAIKLLREYEPDEGYYLAFSGGKDSIVLYDIALKSGVKFDAHYCVSPIDPPEIFKFIKEHYPDVIWDYHARGFWNMVAKKGLPTRISRWCCEIIKESSDFGRVTLTGVRASESKKRSSYNYIQTYIKSKDKKKVMVFPILGFTEYDVWQYIRNNDMPYCSLYDEGFKRIGCVMCPLGGNVIREMDRFPKIAALWKRACCQIVDRWREEGTGGKHKDKTGEELFNWWLQL